MKGYRRTGVYTKIYFLLSDVFPTAFTAVEIADKEDLDTNTVSSALYVMQRLRNVEREGTKPHKYKLTERGRLWASILRLDEND